ncbi:MAG TPA: hypothetical protein P5081_21455 [Phycisphaerae bacterium]|nr:hypothetical protein [Phycisphaerae bacterium]HRW55448.1 hypothetical protein [Phycisphaerae bacterium]
MTRVVCVGILLLAVVAPASLFAQIDYRGDYYQGGASRSFDANNRVGSGGLNYSSRIASPYSYTYGVYSNQVITGNVTGLSSFQGGSAIPGVNQFRVGLQSDSLAAFRSRSVNYSQVRNGTAQRSTGYYDPATSIADVGAIRAGLNQPGSSFLSSPQTRLPAYSLQGDRDRLLGIRDYSSPQTFSASPYDLNTAEIGRITQRPIRPDGAQPTVGASALARDPYLSAMRSTLFGAPQLASPAEELYTRPQMNRPVDGRISTELTRDELLGIMDRRGADAGARDESSSPMSDNAAFSAPFDDLVQGVGRTDRVVLPQDDPDATSTDELYGRMMEAVRRAEEVGSLDGFMARRKVEDPNARDPMSGLMIGSRRRDESTSPAVESNPAGGATPQDELNPNKAELTRDDPMSGRPALDPRAEWADLFMRTPIRSFSLGGATRVGQYLRSGEEALKKGEFNRAVRMFDLAATVDPGNPIPLLGRAHAQIATGQYVSAVLSLESGLQAFPEIAAFELDLPSLTGQTDVFDRRRADLESILERGEQYELRFLLGYIELYSGFHYDGMNDLEKAARSAPAGGVIASFPDMLLGRKPIGPQDR